MIRSAARSTRTALFGTWLYNDIVPAPSSAARRLIETASTPSRSINRTAASTMRARVNGSREVDTGGNDTSWSSFPATYGVRRRVGRHDRIQGAQSAARGDRLGAHGVAERTRLRRVAQHLPAPPLRDHGRSEERRVG